MKILNVKNKAQVADFIREIDDHLQITEELAALMLMKETTITGIVLRIAVETYMKELELFFGRCDT